MMKMMRELNITLHQRGRSNMKKLKKLTRRQIQILASAGYDFMEYLLERQNDKDHTYTYVHRTTKEVVVLNYK